MPVDDNAMTTATYHPYLGAGRIKRLRPADRASIALHEHMGNLLKIAYRSADSLPIARRHIDVCRGVLDDWLAIEYPDRAELPSERFWDAYYHDDAFDKAPRRLFRPTIKDLRLAVSCMRSFGDTLRSTYVDCEPVRDLLARAEKTIAAFSKAKTAPAVKPKRTALV